MLESSTERDTHEYIARRPQNLKSCERFKNQFLRLTKNTKVTCISGSIISDRVVDEFGKIHSSWVFDKYKTKLGCASYFEGECSLRYQLRHGCKVGKRKTVKLK